jgi:hypothetical protein
MKVSERTNRELIGTLYDAVAYHCGESVIDARARQLLVELYCHVQPELKIAEIFHKARSNV